MDRSNNTLGIKIKKYLGIQSFKEIGAQSVAHNLTKIKHTLDTLILASKNFHTLEFIR